MDNYLDLIDSVINFGVEKGDSSGTGTLSEFGTQTYFDLRDGFPLVTTKKVNIDTIIKEILFFIRAGTNNQELNDVGVNIWNEWADENNSLGKIYGYQWRNWEDTRLEIVPFGDIKRTEFKTKYEKLGYKLQGSFINGDAKLTAVFHRNIDQLQNAIDLINNNPDSRRIVVSAWNPAQLHEMALPPCHMMFQFNVEEVEGVKYLDLLLYMRSNDLGLGAPYNIASYALIMMMVAKITGCVARYYIHTVGDTHIYKNHIEKLEEQLKRSPNDLPVITIKGEHVDIDQFKFEDFVLSDYEHYDPIKLDIAVVK